MGVNPNNTPGLVARGGDVPVLNPHEIIIVGLDVPKVPALWWAFCPRLDEEIAEVKAEQRGEFVPSGDLSLDSIRQHGVIVPMDVYKLRAPVRVGDRRTLPINTSIAVDGRRRLLRGRIVWDEQAAQRVPVAERKGAVRTMIRTGEPADLFRFNRIGNARKQLRPEHHAELARLLLEHLPGADDLSTLTERIKIAAAEMGVHPRTISNWLAIGEVAPEARKAMTEGVEVDGEVVRFPVSRAPDLARLPAPEQVQAIEQFRAEGAPSAEVVKHQLAAKKRGQPAPKHNEVKRLRSVGVVERLHDLIPDDRTLAFGRNLLAWLLGDDNAADELPMIWQGWITRSMERPPRSSGEKKPKKAPKNMVSTDPKRLKRWKRSK